MNIDGETLLYDAGTTINDALDDHKVPVESIDNIYISHLHADHAGGIEYLAFKRYFGQFPFGINKATLIGDSRILKDGWNHVWSGGLKTIHGKINTLKDYFNIKKMKPQLPFIIKGIPFYPVQNKHVDDELSFGLEFKDDNCWVFISGDSKAPLTNKELMVLSYYDLIFHDCEFAEYPNSVHAQFHELCTLPSEIKSKMWLYHYSLNGITTFWNMKN